MDNSLTPSRNLRRPYSGVNLHLFYRQHVPSILGNHRVIMIAFKAQRGVLAERLVGNGMASESAGRQADNQTSHGHGEFSTRLLLRQGMGHASPWSRVHLRSIGVREDQGRLSSWGRQRESIHAILFAAIMEREISYHIEYASE